jgi:hypothetical protein
MKPRALVPLAGVVVVVGLCSVAARRVALEPAGTVGTEPACEQLYGWIIRHQDRPVPGASDSVVQRDRADLSRARAKVTAIALAAERWCAERGSGEYPSSLTALVDHARRLPSPSPCRVHEGDLVDPWDHPIFYELHDGVPFIVSAGPDGRFSTTDDVLLPPRSDARAWHLTFSTVCQTP